MHVEPRVILDAGRRGELQVSHAGRTPVVTRSEVTRWLSRSRSSLATVASEKPLSPREAARRNVAARATRAA
jgi:hypothetical protein